MCSHVLSPEQTDLPVPIRPLAQENAEILGEPQRPAVAGSADALNMTGAYRDGSELREEAELTADKLMDAAGPGCVVRFWTGGKPATGTLRCYLDGAAEPAIAAQMQDLLAGRGLVTRPLAVENPKEAGNLYLPIPYAQYCTITYDEVNPRQPAAPPPLRWYNIEYRTYAAGAKVQTFTLDAFKAQASAIERAGRALLAPPAPAGTAVELNHTLEPGQEAAVPLPAGPGAVRLLTARLGSESATAWRALVLRIECDGAETVWCPLGDFFGSGAGVNALESWQRTVVKGGPMTCRWVMPYRKSARFAVQNLGQEKVELKLSARIGAWKWDARSMHFHANWRQQNPLPTQPRSDWNYIAATGQGVYVGDTLTVFNPVPDWWGEGDEKVWVDGENFPSHFGTGSEDHYGYAWGDTRLFQGPFVNQIRCDGPGNQGYTVVTRTRSLDAIPFVKSLNFDLEVWHWNNCQVAYAAATYWYARPGAKSNRGPLPAEALTLPAP